MCNNFAHLHVHSDGSTIDGLGPVSHLVGTAKALGFTRLGLTDHGTLKNAISFSQACQHNGIKPVLGLEAYVSLASKRYHLTLLADGNRGFETLVTLNNMGMRSDDTSRPTFSLEALRRHNDGIIVMTGCPASPFQDADWADALDLGRDMKSYLGDRLFAEVMFVSTSGSWERAAKLAKDLKIHPIVTNDVHFGTRAEAPAHQVLTKIKANFTYDSALLFMATPAELRERVRVMGPEYMPLLESGMRNAARLADKLEVVKFSDTPKLPHIENDAEILREKTFAGYRARSDRSELLSGTVDDYTDRLNDELEVIISMNFSAYFIILKDIIDFARASNVWVGPGRGSGAGSLVLYMLGITDVDPLKYGLSFDRFLNRKRKEMPDVDVDIESERRDVVIEYAMRKWGAKAVATYSRFSHKSLVHALGRVWQMPRELHQEAADEGPESAAWDRMVAKGGDEIQVAYDAMLGQIQHIGQHAGGVVIVDDKEPVPLERTAQGGLVAGWTEGEYRELSKAGIVKYDLLGLAAGSVLRYLEEKFKCKAPEPVDDDPVFEIFRDGNTTGIFQFSGSQGIIDFTRKVAPRRFDDLVAINALYRPGALDSGAAKNYPEWRDSPRLLHPLVDKHLEETYGVICYQEQFMEIFATLTGGTLSDADIARKVLTKARPGQPDWEAKFAELKMKFFEGAEERGMPTSTTEKIWSEIVTHTRYSFNKSHSVAYAMVAWQMAWWKYNHPADFYAAMLTADTNEWQRYLFDVIALGIEVMPPHVNRSTERFEAEAGKIYLPLNVTKFLGSAGVDAIMANRPFTDVPDFMARVAKRAVSGRARAGLFALGAFEGLDGADIKTLGIKELPPMTELEIQETYMGVFLPDAKLMKAIENARATGYVAGVVNFKERREGKWGEYFVYHLLPEGAFWSKNFTSIEIGDKIKVKLKPENGRASAIYPLV